MTKEDEHIEQYRSMGEFLTESGLPYTRNNREKAYEVLGWNNNGKNVPRNRQISENEFATGLSLMRAEIGKEEPPTVRTPLRVEAKKSISEALPKNNTKKGLQSKFKQSQEALRKLKRIILPNGEIIEVKRDTSTTAIIRGVLRAKRENTLYPEGKILDHKTGPQFISDRPFIENAIARANIILNRHQFELTRYDIEQPNGKKTKALDIVPQGKPTSSPAPGSPKD